MNNQQSNLLLSIDQTSKLLTDLVIQGVKMGIPKEVMQAHCRAYFTSNVGRELYRMFQKPIDLFTTFPKQDEKT